MATILSAQSTDKRVNLTTPAVFTRYPTAEAYAQADRAELEELIHPTGFFRNKASSLIGLGQALIERFNGEVPATMAELVTLPGVGRKTANVILGNAFGVPGITVDTHFGRLVRRWRWTAEEDPVKVCLLYTSSHVAGCGPRPGPDRSTYRDASLRASQLASGISATHRGADQCQQRCFGSAAEPHRRKRRGAEPRGDVQLHVGAPARLPFGPRSIQPLSLIHI